MDAPRLVLGWVGMVLGWPGLGWVGMVLGWPGLGWPGLGWPGLGWVGMVLGWPGLGWVGMVAGRPGQQPPHRGKLKEHRVCLCVSAWRCRLCVWFVATIYNLPLRL